MLPREIYAGKHDRDALFVALAEGCPVSAVARDAGFPGGNPVSLDRGEGVRRHIRNSVLGHGALSTKGRAE
jgi:hypothetical protein